MILNTKPVIYNYVVYLDRLLSVMQNTYPETYKKKLQQGVYFIRKKFSNWTITVEAVCQDLCFGHLVSIDQQS